MGTLSVDHILVSESEKITYLRCRDIKGKAELFCIYDNRLAKRFEGGQWQIVNQQFTERIVSLAGSTLHKRPTFMVSNIESAFVN